MNKIELEENTIDDITFLDACLDVDYIGWKYRIHNNNKKIVIMNNFHHIHIYLNGSGTIEKYNKLQLYISDWENFHKFTFPVGYYVLMLVFDHDLDNNTIVKTCIKHIKNLIEENYIDEEHYIEYIKYLDSVNITVDETINQTIMIA